MRDRPGCQVEAIVLRSHYVYIAWAKDGEGDTHSMIIYFEHIQILILKYSLGKFVKFRPLPPFPLWSSYLFFFTLVFGQVRKDRYISTIFLGQVRQVPTSSAISSSAKFIVMFPILYLGKFVKFKIFYILVLGKLAS